MEKKHVLEISLVVVLIVVIILNVVIAIVVDKKNDSEQSSVRDQEILANYLEKQGFKDIPTGDKETVEAYLRKSGFTKSEKSTETAAEYFRKAVGDEKVSVINIVEYETEEEANKVFETLTSSKSNPKYDKNGSFVYEDQSTGVKTSGAFLKRGNSVYSTFFYVKDSSVSTLRNIGKSMSYDEITAFLLRNGYVLKSTESEYLLYQKEYGEYMSLVSQVKVYDGWSQEKFDAQKKEKASYKLSKYPDVQVIGQIGSNKELYISLDGCGCIINKDKIVFVEEETTLNKTINEYFSWLEMGGILLNNTYKTVASIENYALDNGYALQDGVYVKAKNGGKFDASTLSSGMQEFLSEYLGSSTAEIEITKCADSSAAMEKLSSITVDTDETQIETSLDGKLCLYREYRDGNDDYVNGEIMMCVEDSVVAFRMKTPSTRKTEVIKKLTRMSGYNYNNADKFKENYSESEYTLTENVYTTASEKTLTVIRSEYKKNGIIDAIVFYSSDTEYLDKLYEDLSNDILAVKFVDKRSVETENSYVYVNGMNNTDEKYAAVVRRDGAVLLLGRAWSVKDLFAKYLPTA